MKAEIRQVAPQLTVAVKIRTSIPQLGSEFDKHLPAIIERLGELAIPVGGPPFARYHTFAEGEDAVDVEIGFPLGSAEAAGLPAMADLHPGDIGTSELPGGEAAVTVHRGPYEGLRAAYLELLEWIRAEGREEGSGPWESYVDDPGAIEDVSDVRTEIVWPLA
jgi:AraC family transcriptional regulator